MKIGIFILLSVFVSTGFAGRAVRSKGLGRTKSPAITIELSSKKSKYGEVYKSNLGNIVPGKNARLPIRLKSNDNADILNVLSFTKTGTTGFTFENDGCTGASLSHGQACYVDVVFTPSVYGVQQAQVAVTFEDSFNGDGVMHPGGYTSIIDASSFDNPSKCPVTAPGSIIDVASQSLGEVVPLNGVPFQLFYTTQFAPEYVSNLAQFTPAFSFNLQGWTLSLQHLYLANQERLFLGNGSVSDRKNAILSNGNLMVVSPGGDEVYIFSPEGKHLETRTFLTGALKYSFVYDTNDRLVQVVDAYNKKTTMVRNSSGLITSIVGPFGQTTTFSTNASGLFSSVTNPNGEVYLFTYKTGTGLLETFTKPGGQVSTFTYDSNGKLTKDLGHGGNFWELIAQTGGVIKSSQMGRQTSYLSSYDVDGNLVSTQTDPSGYPVSSTEALNGSTVTDYQYQQEEHYKNNDPRFGSMHSVPVGSKITIDGNDMYSENRHEVQYPDGVTPSWFNFSVLTNTNIFGSKTSIDVFDNLKKTRTLTSAEGVISKIAYDNNEKPISIKLGSDIPQTFSYNSLGQLVFTAQGSKNQTAYEYNNQGFIKSITNNRSESVLYNYDLSGRKTSTITSDGRVVQFGYDQNGNMTSLTPPNKPTHYFEFNAMELPSKYLPPSLAKAKSKTVGNEIVYAYNLDKQLTSITNPTGDVLTFDYNSTTGLLHTITSPVANSNHEFTYLTNSNQVATRKTPFGNTQKYTYHGAQMKSEEIVNWADATYGKISYDFDWLNRVNVRTDSDRDAVHVYPTYISYNDDDQPVRYGNMSLDYNSKNGRLSSTSLGVVKDSYTYDQYGALSKYNAMVSGISLYSYELTRDNMSRVIAKTETVQGVKKVYKYTYDTAGRLLEVLEDGVSIGSFVYDMNGNRTSTTLNGTTYASTFDAQDRMQNFGAQTYTYDANGNLIQSITGIGIQIDYARDFNGDLSYQGFPGPHANGMGYDYQRRLIYKGVVQRGTNDIFVYDAQNRIAAAYDFFGTMGHTYHYPTGSHSPDFLTVGYDTYRIIKDHLGSPILVVKTYDGSIAQKLAYNVLGKAVVNTDPLFQPFGYAGGFYDNDTKTVRFGVRDYDTETGRWLTKDPIRFRAAGTNLYQYVINDPINLIDPSGMDYQHCNRPLKGAGGLQVGALRHDYLKYSDGSTTSYGPQSGTSGPGHNDKKEEGGTCGPNVTTTDEQEKKMKDYADQNASNDYDLLDHNCRDFMWETIHAGER